MAHLQMAHLVGADLSGGDLAEEIRQYFIPDFTTWKNHDAFEVAFTRLLRDLQAAAGAAPGLVAAFGILSPAPHAQSRRRCCL